MRLRLLLVLLALLLLAALPAYADGTAGTAGAVLVRGGPTTLAVTASFPVAHWKSMDFSADLMLTGNGDAGAGLSVGTGGVVRTLGWDEALSPVMPVLDRLAVGGVVMRRGKAFDCGAYYMLRLWQSGGF